MKLLIAALLLVSAPLQAQVTQLKSGDAFEGADRGCLWGAEVGRCVVQNQFHVPIQCDISISAKTAKGFKLGNVRHVRIEPFKYDDSSRIYVAHGDTFVSVSETADCKIE